MSKVLATKFISSFFKAHIKTVFFDLMHQKSHDFIHDRQEFVLRKFFGRKIYFLQIVKNKYFKRIKLCLGNENSTLFSVLFDLFEIRNVSLICKVYS